MKKILALALALALMLALCACGSQHVGGSVSPKDDAQQSAAPVESAEPQAEETPAESAEPVESAAPQTEDGLEVGTVVGGRYENSFLGIGCELDENWVFANEQQLAQIAGMTADMFTGDFAEQAKAADMFYDLYAERLSGGATINLVIQKVGLLAGLGATEEQIVDATIAQMGPQLEAAGFSNVQMEKNTVSFAGQERVGIYISAEIQGAPIYEQQVCIKNGQHVASITLATVGEDATETLAGYFFALD